MAKVSDAHLAARRRSIVMAACSVFSRKGVESATMAEIAAEAGLSPGAIYRYFENKEELAKGCMGENAHELEQQWQHAPGPAAAADAMGEFSRLSRLTFSNLNEPDEAFHSLLMLEQILIGVREGGTRLAEMRDGFALTRDGICQRLEIARQAGQLPRGMKPAFVAAALFSFYMGARVCKLVDPELDTDGQLDQIMALLPAITPAQPATV
ncbi:MAG: hypothetical protein C0506_06320 [Anaerolinea sp.]|nr:hypothetical protein [Anaerolinea sp.]